MQMYVVSRGWGEIWVTQEKHGLDPKCNGKPAVSVRIFQRNRIHIAEDQEIQDHPRPALTANWRLKTAHAVVSGLSPKAWEPGLLMVQVSVRSLNPKSGEDWWPCLWTVWKKEFPLPFSALFRPSMDWMSPPMLERVIFFTINSNVRLIQKHPQTHSEIMLNQILGLPWPSQSWHVKLTITFHSSPSWLCDLTNRALTPPRLAFPIC